MGPSVGLDVMVKKWEVPPVAVQSVT